LNLPVSPNANLAESQFETPLTSVAGRGRSKFSQRVRGASSRPSPAGTGLKRSHGTLLHTDDPNVHLKVKSKCIENVAPAVKRSRTAEALAAVPDLYKPPVSECIDSVAAAVKSRRASRCIPLGVIN